MLPTPTTPTQSRRRNPVAALLLIGAVAVSTAFPIASQAQQAADPLAPAPDPSQPLPTTAEGWSRYLGNPFDNAGQNGGASSGPTGRLPIVTRAGEVMSNALSLIGVRYRFGGTSPESGFDCSGLVRWTFQRTLGVVLPHRAADIASVGNHVSKEELKPGDLVFFGTLKRAFTHVGIYLGDGRFVHAPASGGKVRIDELSDEYWTKHWDGARRVLHGGGLDPNVLDRLRGAADDKTVALPSPGAKR
ncbi:C40 family peptidase [Derxia gummosa]|uniref:C40 family peptidase n=1 Tax=Derxia gummosa DSM 723 TaxID=1121388 RepID=A0A8B6XA68_9BURK|nr:C40 family peptidase [Derxia gummosa]